MLFTSFEDLSNTSIQSDKFKAHAGNNCYQAAPDAVVNNDGTLLGKIEGGTQIWDNGLVVRWWSKASDGSGNANQWMASLTDEAGVSYKGTSKVVARTGEWSLFESTFKGLPSSGVLTPKLENTSGIPMYLDDFRLQPLDSKMGCYVYDNNNLRLLATFDDQHFGMYYQYDAEGKLVRKLVETERGVKTVTETQYNTPGRAR